MSELYQVHSRGGGTPSVRAEVVKLKRHRKLKPFSLSLGFLGFAGGGKWFGVECDGHDDDDAVFLHCSLFCIVVVFCIGLGVLGFAGEE